MKLTLDRIDMTKEGKKKNCSQTTFGDFLPGVQVAIRAVGRATFYEFDKSNYNAIYAPKIIPAEIKKFDDLIGHTFSKIENLENEELVITLSDGAQYKLYHEQDCCESVTIEDVCGDLDDLLNSPILMAEEVTSDNNPDGVSKDYQDSFLWTFYKLATVNGYVTIRWYGESNGYYSESVSFVKIR